MARTMKDSGVKWIGTIPEDWETIKIKYTSWLKGRIGWQGLKSNEYQEVGAHLITGVDFMGGSINWDSCVRISEERFNEAPEIHIKEGDLLITKDGTIGKVAIAKNCPKQVSLNSGVLLIRNTKDFKYYDKYLYYVLLSDEFWTWYEMSQTGNSTIRHLYQEQFYNFEFTFPKIDEQKNIADFLDDKVGKIDVIISKSKESIEGYKKLKQSVINEAVIKGLNKRITYKKSDIEFVDVIPEHWVEMKNNFLFRENVRPYCEGDIPLSLSQVDGLIPTADMKESSLKTASYDNWKKVVVGDLVLNRFKAHLGVLFASTLEGMVSFHYGVYEPQRKLVTKYYEYLYHSDYYKAIYAGMSNGMVVGLQNLSNVNFYAVKSLYPPYEEQVEIVTYLDERCAEIETLIAKKEAFIEEMEAYKKSLIYEYVTGKKEVL